MQIRVFKFGGASVNNASGIRNVASILHRYTGSPILMVISAMGKMTNAFEQLLNHYMEHDPVAMVEAFQKIQEYHLQIVKDLFADGDHFVFKEVESLLDQLKGYLRKGHLYSEVRPGYDYEYDQIVSYGELISAAIVHHYLVESGFNCRRFDARELICTDSNYRDAKVDWKTTAEVIQNTLEPYFMQMGGRGSIALTQGFIAADKKKNTTTLGREGSDFSAAIFAYCLKSKEMTIWKDVPGVLNADPKYFENPRRLPSLSYREAIELAYYGASIIHPKTIKPLENENITLNVKSFLLPGHRGTTIKHFDAWNISTPIYIFKPNQVLISLSPRDFSFIVEENLSQIFEILSSHQVKVNMMQNSAISFSVCVDHDARKLPILLDVLREAYEIRYNEGLALFTIRHYTPASVKKVTLGRKILMEQKSRNTIQIVVG